MNAKERAEVLRKRFKTLFPGAPRVSPEPRQKPAEERTPLPWRSSVYGVSMHEADRRKKWLASSDPAEPIAPRPNRRNGVSALTRIAAHFPAKLPQP